MMQAQPAIRPANEWVTLSIGPAEEKYTNSGKQYLAVPVAGRDYPMSCWNMALWPQIKGASVIEAQLQTSADGRFTSIQAVRNPAGSQPAQTSQSARPAFTGPANQPDGRDVAIRRQVALKAAQAAFGLIPIDADADTLTEYLARVEMIADAFERWMVPTGKEPPAF